MMSIPNRDKSFSGSKMGVLLQRSFSTVVLLGLLAGALWWDCELGYYGLVCIFCIGRRSIHTIVICNIFRRSCTHSCSGF